MSAGLLAGCGGSSSPSLSAFKQGFAAEKAQFQQLGTQLATAIRTAPQNTDAELATQFASLSSSAVQQAARLRKLDPPSAYKSQVGQLASDFDTVAGDLHKISSAATAGDARAARAASTTLVQDSSKLKAVDVAITGRLRLPQAS
ncbi:MAG: hypothetical protein ACYC91_09310 [Solirubrobacteraceae bacterium]